MFQRFLEFKYFYLVITIVIVRQFITGHAGVVNWSVHKPSICVYDDNFTRPGGDKSIDVYVSLILSDLYDISEERMEFAVQIYLLDFWKDPSLKMDNVKIKVPERMPVRISDCVWKPDIVFVNSKDAKLYDATFPNINFKIMPNGYIYRLSRYRLLLSCHMDFKFYPMDTQLCYIAVSFLSTMLNDATLSWTNEEDAPPMLAKIPSISMFDNVKPLQFSMKEPYSAKYNLTALTGKMSVVLCYIPLHRHLTASLLWGLIWVLGNIGSPSLLVVCLSWVSFWLEASAIPGRVTLGVTALLTLATEIVHARSVIPSVDYMTAMDIWLFGCMVMVFLSLIEFTMAQAYARKPNKMSAPSPAWTQNGDSTKAPSSANSSRTTTRVGFVSSSTNTQAEGQTIDSQWAHIFKSFQHVQRKNSKKEPRLVSIPVEEKDNALDRVSRYLFPSVMIVFITTYCAYYSSRESVKSAEKFFSLKGIKN